MDVPSPSPAAAPATVTPLARRPRDLRGTRIGILDNSKPNADTLLGRVAERLVERAGAAGAARWRKPGASKPAADHVAIAAGADVFLTGSAD
jgi:hypothetical protein